MLEKTKKWATKLSKLLTDFAFLVNSYRLVRNLFETKANLMPNSRIKYNDINIDLERVAQRFTIDEQTRKSEMISGSGVQETLTYFSQDFLEFSRDSLKAQEIEELREFIEYAKDDGSTFQFEYDKDLGGYIGFEGKSLNTNDEVAGTFTRTGTAYYEDHITGLIVSAAGNTARFPAGKYGRGVMISGARTNLITDPSRLGATPGTWSLNNMTVGENESFIKDPAGTNTAERLLATADNASALFNTSTAVGNDATFNIWLTTDDATEAARIAIGGTTLGSVTSAVSVTTEWQPYQMTTDSSAFTGNLYGGVLVDNNGGAVYAWDGALYDSATFAGRVSPDPTATSSATLNAELLLYAVGDMLTKEQGTIAFWVKPEWDFDDHDFVRFFAVDRTGDADRAIEIGITAAGNFAFTMQDVTGSDAFTLAGSGSGLARNTWAHLAFVWDTQKGLAGSTEVAQTYVDGVKLAGDTGDPFNAIELGTSFAIGSDIAGTNPAFCTFDDVLLRKNALNASEIQNIYNQGRGIGARRNRWSSLLLVDTGFAPIWRSGNRYNLDLRFKEELT